MGNETQSVPDDRRRTVLKGIGIAGIGTGTVPVFTGNGLARSRGSVRAGAAAVPITPKQKHRGQGVFLGGFGDREGPATGVRDEIYARTLAVGIGSRTVTFTVLDTIGIGNRMLAEMRREAKKRVASSANLSEVLIGATHTHAGPDFQGLWGGVPESYFDYVVDQTAKSVFQAVRDREPARFVVGTASADELNTNRRGHPEADSTVTVLQARSASNRSGQRQDKTIATLVNYAAHPVLLGSTSKVATDFVGPLIRDVEDAFGGVGLFFNGAVGDASAIRPEGDKPERTDTYGFRLADAAIGALDDPRELSAGMTSQTTSVTLLQENREFDLPYRFGLFDGYYEFESAGGVPLSLDTKVTRVTFGASEPSLDLLTIPGEALTNLGFELRDRLSADDQILLGLTCNSLGYFVPLEEWMDPRRGLYEESVSFGKRAVPNYRDGVEQIQ